MVSLSLLFACATSAAAALIATPRDTSFADLSLRDINLSARSISTDGVCGGYNNTNTCTGSAFGSCCSRFGYCGSTDGHCGFQCQASYGSCVVKTPAVTWASVGCYTDGGNAARTLRTSQNVGSNSVEACTAACAAGGFSYAGMEFGSQCFCDNTIATTAAAVTDGCTMACSGNSAEICGGPSRLSVYTVAPVWQSMGCYSDDDKARSLSVSINMAGNTQEACQAACKAGGYKYSGTEFGAQCFCGATLASTAQQVGDGCLTPCPGNNAEMCGGSNRLTLFIYE